MLETDAALIEERAIGIVGIDHGEARTVEIEMACDQRQCAAPDRTEADHDDRTGDARVNGPLRHGWKLREGRGKERALKQARARRSRLALPLRAGESDAHHVRCAGCAERYAGDDDDAVAFLRKALAV